MERAERVRLQLDAAAVLRGVKRLLGLTYRELAGVVGVPESVLSRYATGDMLPSVETAGELLERLEGAYPLSAVVGRLARWVEGYVDLSFVGLPDFWRLYEVYLWRRLGGAAVDKVLTAAVDGIPLAVAAAGRFDAGLVVAKQHKEPGVEVAEHTFVREGRPVTLYVPAKLLARGDRVLIIDDVARTGRTLRALAALASARGAKVVAASVLVGSRAAVEGLPFPVDVVYPLPA